MTDTTNTTVAETISHAQTKDAPQPEMTSFEMACSILVGLDKAITKAGEERQAALKASGGKPMAGGEFAARVTGEALLAAYKELDAELAQVARSCRLPMPKIGR